jgi:hydrogenase-4 transcriptional activator
MDNSIDKRHENAMGSAPKTNPGTESRPDGDRPMSLRSSVDSLSKLDLQTTEHDEFFRAISECVCGTLSLNQGLEQALPRLAEHIPLDVIQLTVIDAGKSNVRSVAWANRRETLDGFAGSLRFKIPPELVIEADRLGSAPPPIINRPMDDSLARLAFEKMGLPLDVSLLSVELDDIEGNEGKLMLVARGNDRYRQEHWDLLESLRVPFNIALSNALRYEQAVELRDRLEEDNRALRRELRQDKDMIIGARHGLRQVMEMVERVAPTDSPVLLLGETGVGKEVIATAVHDMSPRRNRTLLRLNCGAIPENLVDSELFGHEKGSFTGAFNTKPGLFERANGSTIFLDEIGELPLAAQVKLLRVLQTMEFERVGGTETIKVDVRVVAATHQDLGDMVERGLFREDLWYRLDVFPIRIPPLRERRDDIPLFTSYFMETRARELNIGKHPQLGEGAIDQLLNYPWPGNVRELRNVIERALILSRGAPLTFPELHREPLTDEAEQQEDSAVSTLDEAQASHIRKTLALTKGKIKGPGGAAELLGLHPSTLRNKMLRLGIAQLDR